MAATNAWLHWKLKNPEEAEKAMARYNFFESIANSLLLTDWTQYAKGAGGETEKQFRALFGLTDDAATAVPAQLSTSTTTCTCNPLGAREIIRRQRNKRRRFTCQVCAFEGKEGLITRSVCICLDHRVRCCVTVEPEKKLMKADGKTPMTDYSWRAPPDWTCWDKMHKFYLPKGLFRANVQLITEAQAENERNIYQNLMQTSEPFRGKREAMGLPLRTRPPKKGRKKQK